MVGLTEYFLVRVNMYIFLHCDMNSRIFLSLIVLTTKESLTSTLNNTSFDVEFLGTSQNISNILQPRLRDFHDQRIL